MRAVLGCLCLPRPFTRLIRRFDKVPVAVRGVRGACVQLLAMIGGGGGGVVVVGAVPSPCREVSSNLDAVQICGVASCYACPPAAVRRVGGCPSSKGGGGGLHSLGRMGLFRQQVILKRFLDVRCGVLWPVHGQPSAEWDRKSGRSEDCGCEED